MCANYHYSNAPMGASYIKTLTEVWDPYQLRAVQIGGNKALYEFLRDYGKERDEIEKKYRGDPARFYARSLSFRVKNLPFLEKAPPKNAQEAAQRAAESSAVMASSAWSTTSKAAGDFDDKYKVTEKTSQAFGSAKGAVMGWFNKAQAPSTSWTTNLIQPIINMCLWNNEVQKKNTKKMLYLDFMKYPD